VLVAVASSLGLAIPQAAQANRYCAAHARSEGALVQLWRGTNCKGASVVADGWRPDFKAFDDAATGQVVDVNNDISSVAIKPGHCVRFWNRSNYQGDPSKILCTPPDPQDNAMSSISFDDRAASLKVCADDRRAECNADGPPPSPGGGDVPPPPPPPTPRSDSPKGDDEANDLPFPGADTVALHDGSDQYGSFGASTGRWKVPWARHGSGNEVGSTSTVSGDALPNGGGAWAEPGSNIWTPGAFYKVKKGVGRYYLFYTATAANSGGRKCVGVAHSTQPFTGYVAEPKPLVCPTKGDRWALDADVTQGAGRAVWMTWRDGQRANGPESALSAMRLRFRRNGDVDRGSRPRVIMRSDGLAWAHHHDGGVTVIENPSAFLDNGSWYLFYSGNSWQTNYYATGIAHCGPRLADGPCRQMPNDRVAWFAYAAPNNALPPDMRKYRLPGNKRGPGAMDVYRARDGRPWVTWNYLSDAGGRKSRTGRLIVTGGGAAADFRVD
jgi:hypothetical protein